MAVTVTPGRVASGRARVWAGKTGFASSWVRPAPCHPARAGPSASITARHAQRLPATGAAQDPRATQRIGFSVVLILFLPVMIIAKPLCGCPPSRPPSARLSAMPRTSPPRSAPAIDSARAEVAPPCAPSRTQANRGNQRESRHVAATASPGQGRAFHEHQSIRISFLLSDKENVGKLTIGKSLKYGRSVVAFSLPGSHGRTAHVLSGPGKQPSPSRRFVECRSGNCGNPQDKFCALVHHSVFTSSIVFRKYLAPIGPEFREN